MKNTILVNYLDNDNDIKSYIFIYEYVYKDFAQRHKIIDMMNFKLIGKTYEQKRKSAADIKNKYLKMFYDGNITQCDLNYLHDVLKTIALKSGYTKEWIKEGVL